MLRCRVARCSWSAKLVSFALASLVTLQLRAEEPPPTAQAERIYAEGERAYNTGDYAAAAVAFERAYRLSGVTELMFDIGQAHRLAGRDHCEPARRSYAAYLAAFPDSKQRALVEQYLSELGECAPPAPTITVAPAPAAKPLPTTTAPAAQPSRAVWPLVVAGAGAAVAVGGAAVWVRSRMKYDEVKDTCPCPPGTFDSWERMSYAGYALVAVGVAASATGLVLWRMSANDDSARVMLGPTGLQLVGHL